MNELMKKVGGGIHRLYMGLFGNTKGATVGTFNVKEFFAAIAIGTVFYFVGGDLQTVLHQLDPNGTVVDSISSAVVAFIVSMLHKGATGTKLKDGSTYIPADHAK